jgi:hypothetical protein
MTAGTVAESFVFIEFLALTFELKIAVLVATGQRLPKLGIQVNL